MLKSSWALDQVISQWSFSSQPLGDFACFWKREYSHFPSLIPGSVVVLFVSILPVQLFPVVELAVCAACL